MKTSSKRRRRPGRECKLSRIEELSASIQNHLAALDEETSELTGEASTAAHRGYTPEEDEAIDRAYAVAPVQMLLITAKIFIDSVREDSGINQRPDPPTGQGMVRPVAVQNIIDHALKIVERHTETEGPTYEIANNLLDLIRECLDYIRNELCQAPEKSAERPPTLH